MALLRPGRCGSRRQGGCLQHRTEAQRQPKGQHAGGTPALPGKAVPADRVAACGIAPSSAAAKGTACGRDARAPGQGCSRRQGGCLQHCTKAQRQPKGQHAGGTPALPGKAVPADRVAACGIAPKLSGGQWDSMRAGRPRSQARPAPQTGWLPVALHGSSAAAIGTACGRDARAPGQGKNREHGLHLSTMHYSFPSWFFVDNSFFPFPTLGGSLSILLQPLRGYLFLSEARPRYFSPDGTRRMRGERLKEL